MVMPLGEDDQSLEMFPGSEVQIETRNSAKHHESSLIVLVSNWQMGRRSAGKLLGLLLRLIRAGTKRGI
jgi:hypothetical protein